MRRTSLKLSIMRSSMSVMMVADPNSDLRGRQVRDDLVDARGRKAQADQHEHGGEDRHGEQEIGDRAGGDHGDKAKQTGFRWNESARCSGVNSLSAARDGVLAALSSSMNLT